MSLTIERESYTTTAKFVISNSPGAQFTFHLTGANGEIMLVSERHTPHVGAMNGIKSVKENAPHDNRYDRLVSRDSKRQRYFVLKAANGEVPAVSEMYSSESAMEAGIASVKAHAPTAVVDVDGDSREDALDTLERRPS